LAPEEAPAVYKCIDDLLDRVCARCGLRIQELCASERITRHDLIGPNLKPPRSCPSHLGAQAALVTT
jgi:hypothetical protein